MSNPVLTHKRCRIRFDAEKWTNQQDVLVSATPRMYRGNNASFEVIVYWNNEIVDLSNLTSLTLGIYTVARTALKVSKTLAAGDITAVPAEAGWTAGTAQHASFAFTGLEMNWALTSGVEETFFLVLSGITNDSPAHDITYGVSSLTLVEDAAGNAGTPPANDPLYYTQAEADARFAQRHADGASWMLKDGQHPYRYYDGLWYPEIVTAIDGKIVITLGQTGVVTP